MKYLHVRWGKLAIVDDDVHEEASKYTWWALSKGHVMGYDKVRKIRTYLAWIVLEPKPTFEIDYINRNPLDNRRENLRHVTRSQNQQNKNHDNRFGTGYRGVYSKGNRYAAKVQREHLGTFNTPVEAAHAYDRKALQVYGPLAALSFETNRPELAEA